MRSLLGFVPVSPARVITLVPKLQLLTLPTTHQYPRLLVRRVNQFEKLEKPSEYRVKTPAASCGR